MRLFYFIEERNRIFLAYYTLDSMKGDLIGLAKLIVPSQMKHHAEAEACDLLMEVEQLEQLQQYVDDSAYNRSVIT